MKYLLPVTFIALASCQGDDIAYGSDDEVAFEGVTTTQYPDTSDSTAESRLAKATLAGLQQLSFDNNREYCGYIVRTAEGEMIARPAKKGREDSCLTNDPEEDDVILASYHTHGAFSVDAYAEFPSASDVEGDEAEGIDGYVSTPGGRFWFVDGTDLVVSQLCSVGCLPMDPNFIEGVDGDLARSYTLQELQDL